MLLLYTPGGFEQFVVEMSEPAPAPPDMPKLISHAHHPWSTGMGVAHLS